MIDLGQSPQHAITETYCGTCGVPESSDQHGMDCPKYPDTIRTMNLATFKHEAETPMRGHDPDGECCRRAATEALTERP